jgi:phospholipid-binding lipoprotein MlaA
MWRSWPHWVAIQRQRAWARGRVVGIFAHPGSKRRWTPVVVSRTGAGFFAFLLLVTPALAQEDPDDPLEPLNRGIFQFNRVLDGLLLEPAAIMYRAATPQFFRTGVRNFLANLTTPVVLANDLLQGEFARAELTLGRFMMNTILGLGGVIDVGGKLGMPDRHYEDFGQTLAVYGVGPGPYLMLPLLGPSSGRDAIGRVVDIAFDPLSVVEVADPGLVSTEITLARRAAEILSFREANLEQIDELERSSIDLYAAVRTLYWQYRANEIRNGAVAEIDDIYDEGLYDDPEGLEEDPADVYEDPEAADD